MKRNLFYIVFSCLAFALYSFAQKVKPSEFLTYYKDNSSNFVFSQESSIFKYKIAFRPLQYNLINFVKDSDKISKKDYKNFIKDNKNNLDFMVQISSIQEPYKEFLKFDNGLQSFDQKVIYYSFEFKNDINLVLDSKDTIKASYYNFERGFDINPNGTFFVSFDTGKKKFKEAKILITNRAYQDNQVAFTFEGAKITAIPQLTHYKKW